MIRILYFASLRERLETGNEQLELPDEVLRVEDLMAHLRRRGGVWDQVLADTDHVLVAVNQEMAKPGDPVRDGDEIGLFPPVTGG